MAKKSQRMMEVGQGTPQVGNLSSPPTGQAPRPAEESANDTAQCPKQLPGPQPREIKDVGFPDFPGKDVGIRYLDTDSIRNHLPAEYFAGPRRLDFHLLLLFVDGRGVHSIDLVRYAVSRGTLLFVRPGQVHEWDSSNQPRTRMLAFRPSFLLPERPEHRDSALPRSIGRWPVHISLSGYELSYVDASLDDFQREIAGSDGSPSSTTLLLHMLCALLIKITRMAEVVSPDQAAESIDNLYRRFRHKLDCSFSTHHTVASYARALGCSEKTLYRAVLGSTEVTPKQLIDERICTEAQRLLVYTTWPVKRIAAELGFREATNFVKFFRRTTGRTPLQFRLERRTAESTSGDSLASCAGEDLK